MWLTVVAFESNVTKTQWTRPRTKWASWSYAQFISHRSIDDKLSRTFSLPTLLVPRSRSVLLLVLLHCSLQCCVSRGTSNSHIPSHYVIEIVVSCLRSVAVSFRACVTQCHAPALLAHICSSQAWALYILNHRCNEMLQCYCQNSPKEFK